MLSNETEYHVVWGLVMTLGLGGEYFAALPLGCTNSTLKNILEKHAAEKIMFPRKAERAINVVAKRRSIGHDNPKFFSELFFMAFSRVEKKISAVEFPMYLDYKMVRTNVADFMHFKYVTYMSFERNVCLTDTMLCDILKHCFSVTNLNLRGCLKLCGAGLVNAMKEKHAADTIPLRERLTTLVLSGCHRLFSPFMDTFEQICGLANGLESLDISGFTFTSEVKTDGLTNLRHLIMRGCKENCHNFFSNLPNPSLLETLDLSMVQVVNHVEALFHFPNLKRFELQGWRSFFTDGSITSIFIHSQQLRELNFIGCGGYFTPYLDNLSSLRELTRLEMKNCLISDDLLCQILLKCEHLCILNVEGNSLITEKSFFACAKGPGRMNKTVLNFKRCGNFSDDGLEAIAANCTYLRVLCIGYTEVSEAVVKEVICRRKNTLQYLELECCKSLTLDFVTFLMNSNDVQLHKINLTDVFANFEPAQLKELFDNLQSSKPKLRVKFNNTLNGSL